MYEPKYKLNKKDDARFHVLLTRHCANYTDVRGREHISREFPPLTSAEEAEFIALTLKRRRKVESHPDVKSSLRFQRKQSLKVERLLARAERVLKKFSRPVDSKY